MSSVEIASQTGRPTISLKGNELSWSGAKVDIVIWKFPFAEVNPIGFEPDDIITIELFKVSVKAQAYLRLSDAIRLKGFFPIISVTAEKWGYAEGLPQFYKDDTLVYEGSSYTYYFVWC